MIDEDKRLAEIKDDIKTFAPFLNKKSIEIMNELITALEDCRAQSQELVRVSNDYVCEIANLRKQLQEA